eukprot:m.31519 g.31519  ORF g.31519 m.31519 type:complete len:534 (+) comp6939_c0_seq1:5025-6626(+)
MAAAAAVPAAVKMTPRDQLLLHTLHTRIGPDWNAISQCIVSLSHEDPGAAPAGSPASAESIFSPANCEAEYTEVTMKVSKGRTESAATIARILRKRHLDELQRSIRKHEEEYKKLAVELQRLKANEFGEADLNGLLKKYEEETARNAAMLNSRKPKLDRFPLHPSATKREEAPVPSASPAKVEVAPAPEAAPMVVDVQDNSISPPKSVKSPVPTADPSTPRVEATPPVEETADAASEGHRTRSRSPSKSATSARSEKKNQRKRPAESSPPPAEPPVATGASGVASQSVAGDVTPRTTRSRRSSPAPRPASTLVPKAVDEDASDVDVSAVRQSRARKRTRVDQVDDDCASDAGSFAPEDHFRYATPEREPNLSMVADVAEEVAADNEENVARAQRSWRASVMQLWHQIAENKNANLFRHPVDPKKVEGYGEVILKPMDLGTIKKYIELGIIVSARDMEYHLMLMYTNALMFNTSGEFVHNATLEMRADTLAQLENFRQIIASSSENPEGGRENRRKKPEEGTPRSKRIRQGRNA